MFVRRRSRSDSSRDADNFDLLIEPAPVGYRARALDPENGREPRVDFLRPFPEETLPKAFVSGGVCRDLKSIQPPSRDEVSEIGSSLFKAIFADEMLVCWLSRLQRAEQAGRALRLRIRLEDSSELWDWPWELLRHPERGFLAVQPATPVLRYVDSREFVRRPLRVRPPIRVLAVAAHPEELGPLSVPEELEELERALRALDSKWVELEFLVGATRGKLLRKLEEKPFHILHFIGHGVFDRDEGGGAILLEGEAGEPDPMTAQELGVLLGAHPEIRLVVLNVCHGARGTIGRPFSGLAQSLIRGGLPAVVAMQATVSDTAAVLFSRTFYESLARREPLDRAISKARNAMFSQGFGTEWAVPILATRSPNCRIFDLSRWEVFRDLLLRILTTWQSLIALGFLLLMLALGFRYTGRRWLDPNFGWALINPAECPSPPGLSIAFVKVEPPGRASFCMARFETTQRLWRRVMGRARTRRSQGGLPAVRISFEDSRRFLGELNRSDPVGHYRLPTEAEWVYAAKGGEAEPPVASAETANCDNREEYDGFEGPAPVGSYPRNALWLFDMLGNASEWVSDGNKPDKRLRLGGSFQNVPRNCSVAFKSQMALGSQPPDAGFRIVREPLR